MPTTLVVFEPPKYLSSLITNINDDAKSAQIGVLSFSVVGLYLIATSLATNDNDLLLQHTTPIAQIGVQVPVIFSFAIAPVVFLFLHVYTLVRYDMLAANLRQFRTDMQVWVTTEADRERCRRLLSNVEFVQIYTAPRNSALYSRLYRIVVWAMLAWFPVTTLIVVQISSLRYQSDVATRIQQICIVLDVILLIWFFYRQHRRGGLPSNASSGWVQYSIFVLLSLVLITLDLCYLNVPGPTEETVFVNKELMEGRSVPKLSEAYKQPLDLLLCPTLHWGCRYLTLDHRTLIGQVWIPQAIASLRAEDQTNVKKSLSEIEGVFLQDRNLRFARFDESRLYAADLMGADLSHASFTGTRLAGANLSRANLSHADFYRAQLSGVDLFAADLSDANLDSATLSGASLSGANLSGHSF
jgi:hypothetical protein